MLLTSSFVVSCPANFRQPFIANLLEFLARYVHQLIISTEKQTNQQDLGTSVWYANRPFRVFLVNILGRDRNGTIFDHWFSVFCRKYPRSCRTLQQPPPPTPQHTNTLLIFVRNCGIESLEGYRAHPADPPPPIYINIPNCKTIGFRPLPLANKIIFRSIYRQF